MRRMLGLHALGTMGREELGLLELGQKDKVKNLGLRELHYMKKFDDGSKAMVVLLWKDGRSYRGCTACVPQDQYVKAVGRVIARGRALRVVMEEDKAAQKGKSEPKNTGGIKRGTVEIPGCDAIKWIKSRFGKYKATGGVDWTAEETALVTRAVK